MASLFPPIFLADDILFWTKMASLFTAKAETIMDTKNMGVEGQEDYGPFQNSMESKFQFCIRKHLLCWN